MSRLAGVSIKTVSNVLHGYPHVRDQTRDRVLRAVAELGYTPNLAARRLRSGRTNMISLLVPPLGHPIVGTQVEAAIAAADGRGLSVVVEQFHDGRRELELLQKPRAQTVDGMIYFSKSPNYETEKFLADTSLPVVHVGHCFARPEWDVVTYEPADAARIATDHLLAMNRKRIVALASEPNTEDPCAARRLDGYQCVMESSGPQVDGGAVIEAASDDPAAGYAAILTLIDKGVTFDGVVATSDALALGAVEALRNRGLSVPGDVAVVGFGNRAEGRDSAPTLSTVHIDDGRRAETAVELLDQRMRGGSGSKRTIVHMPFSLAVRETSTP